MKRYRELVVLAAMIAIAALLAFVNRAASGPSRDAAPVNGAARSDGTPSSLPASPGSAARGDRDFDVKGVRLGMTPQQVEAVYVHPHTTVNGTGNWSYNEISRDWPIMWLTFRRDPRHLDGMSATGLYRNGRLILRQHDSEETVRRILGEPDKKMNSRMWVYYDSAHGKFVTIVFEPGQGVITFMFGTNH